MQTLIPTLPVRINEDQSFLFNMLPIPLSNVPFHENTKSITRYFAEKFPVHIAVHEVSPVINPPATYTQPHVHHDTDEINIIISQRNLVYKIQLGDDEYEVGNNSCIWIPRGMIHAANVLKGSGYFITMRIQ
jgi:mannose-6-phosphate isomerase-like protein (cupin superfamily)